MSGEPLPQAGTTVWEVTPFHQVRAVTLFDWTADRRFVFVGQRVVGARWGTEVFATRRQALGAAIERVRRKQESLRERMVALLREQIEEIEGGSP